METIFDVLSEEDIERISSFQINSTYNLSDPRFGGQPGCETCNEKNCFGHYASLDLGTYIIHPMFSKNIDRASSEICLKCNKVLHSKRSKVNQCEHCKNTLDQKSASILDLLYSEDRSLESLKDTFQELDMREHRYIIRYVLVPPMSIRPKNDVEWPSDLSKAYSSVIKEISHSKKNKDSPEYISSITKLYEKIIDGGKKSILTRLISGKDGIFRGLMKGRRLDKSSRSVIIGDPEIGIDEILVPKPICDRITISERCFRYNVDLLKKEASMKRVFWGDDMEPLEEGDIVEGQMYKRFLRDGDHVLFNRQPSLSKESLMAFKIKIRKDDILAISMNHIVASSFNADFDGDEMNIFMNWSLMSQAELVSMCDVKRFRSLEPIQDTITGSYLLTNSNTFVNRNMIMDCACMLGINIICRCKEKNCKIHDVCRCKDRKCESKNCKIRGFVLFEMAIPNNIPIEIDYPVNKETICRIIPKEIFLKTKKYEIVTKFYENLQKIICRWMHTRGFNVKISDCLWNTRERDKRVLEIDKRMHEKFSKGLENNPISAMVRSGGKGKITNMYQMMASVGHQYTNDDHRENKNRERLVDLGFIKSSYVEGLDPEEFVLHLIASRTGVINTGVQTSSTGYLSRRSSILLADCAVDYKNVTCDRDRVISFPSM